MAKTSIKTTGDLREYLAMSIKAVGNGGMDVQKANSVNKLAGQIHESLYAEAKVAKLKIELGQSAASFGSLELGDGAHAGG